MRLMYNDTDTFKKFRKVKIALEVRRNEKVIGTALLMIISGDFSSRDYRTCTLSGKSFAFVLTRAEVFSMN